MPESGEPSAACVAPVASSSAWNRRTSLRFVSVTIWRAFGPRAACRAAGHVVSEDPESNGWCAGSRSPAVAAASTPAPSPCSTVSCPVAYVVTGSADTLGTLKIATSGSGVAERVLRARNSVPSTIGAPKFWFT